MTIEIYSNGHIHLDDEDTGMGVTQRASGTVVFVRDGAGRSYREIEMPHSRYSLAHDKPASGNPGRQQFEQDLRRIVTH